MKEISVDKELIIGNAVERSNMFMKDAQLDISKISLMQSQLADCMYDNKKLIFFVKDSDAKECKNLYLLDSKLCRDHWEDIEVNVLSVINYFTFPVTAVLDSITLSKEGNLAEALDIRPFMFSGPAPTQIIWAGSDRDSIKTKGFPALTDEDAKAAFKHWIHYIFGLHFNTETGMIEDIQ